MKVFPLFAILGAALVSACAAPGSPEPAAASAPVASLPANARCASAGLAIDTAFPAGAIQSCSISGTGEVAILIASEDEPPINCSPWYAFRVTPAQPAELDITLQYTACGHRYWPKLSFDGVTWDYLEPRQVRVSQYSGRDMARLKIDSDGRPFFVSAQEIIVPATYDSWLDRLATHPDVVRSLLGHSAEGRNIEAITLGSESAEQRESVVLVGRQHPPEVTGALVMLPFVETLLEDTELARAYRARFETHVVPMLNPDGVVRGHWRHNTGGVDLNRDWGPFTQPETRLMRDLLAGIASDPRRDLRLLIDFHSTAEDVFYTIPDEYPTDPPLFTRDWLDRYQKRMPDYAVNRDARHEAGRPISKAYGYDTYGVPAVTFEIGDETDRALIREIGRESAIAMMETLLATGQE